MRNKNFHLKNHLFEQLERLNDDDLTDEQLEKEVKRAKAMSDIAKNIVESAKVDMQFYKLTGTGTTDFVDLPHKKPANQLPQASTDE